VVNVNYSDKSLKRKNNTLKIIIAIFFLLNTYLPADSIYTQAELKELKIIFAKEESERNRKWLSKERKRKNFIPQDIDWRRKYIKWMSTLENIKETDIQIEKTEKNLVVVSYPQNASGPSVLTGLAVLYKDNSQWKELAFKLLNPTEIEFVYLDEDDLPDIIGFDNCCAHMTFQVLLSTDFKKEPEEKLAFSDKDFIFKSGKCNELIIEGFLNRIGKRTKFTFDCTEKKFREVKSFFAIFLNWF
jgi:hypothetical protein